MKVALKSRNDALIRVNQNTKKCYNEKNQFYIHINKHFESSQKLRKDGIGIWKNFIGNMLSNYIL